MYGLTTCEENVYSLLEVAGDLLFLGTSKLLSTGVVRIMLGKLDIHTGALISAKVYAGGGNSDLATEMVLNSEGNIMITGYTTSFGQGGSDALLMEIDPLSLSILRAKGLGSVANEEAFSLAYMNNYYLMGGTALNSVDSANDIFVASFDAEWEICADLVSTPFDSGFTSSSLLLHQQPVSTATTTV